MLAGDQSPMKTAPAFSTSSSRSRPASSGTMSSRCSGATTLATASASSGPSTRQAMPARRQRRLRDRPCGSRRPRCAVDLVHDPVEQVGVPGHQPGQAVGAVLGLDDQVDGRERGRPADRPPRRSPTGRRRPRPRRPTPEHLALRLGDVCVAGAGDDIDGRTRSSRRPGPRWPGPRRCGTPRPPRRRTPRTAWRRDPAVGAGGTQSASVSHPGHTGRGGAHQDGGGIAGPPAGSVEAGPSDGPGQVPDR